jgi:hypothetical protein
MNMKYMKLVLLAMLGIALIVMLLGRTRLAFDLVVTLILALVLLENT